MSAEKICRRCGKRPRAPYQSYCRECSREYALNYYYAHKEECRAQQKAYWGNMTERERELRNARAREWRKRKMLEDPEYAERQRQYAREYYQAHKAELDAQHKEYRKTHKRTRPSNREPHKRWLAAHPDYYKEYRKRKKKERVGNDDEC